MMKNDDKDQLVDYLIAKISETPKFIDQQIKNRGAYFKQLKTYPKLKEEVDSFLLKKHVENRLIILPGLRGVGKTTLLFQLYKYLKEQKKIDESRLLYFSADDLKSYLGKSILHAIDAFVTEVHRTNFPSIEKELFIFIDEAHVDPEWNQTAKIIFDKSKKIFMIFTGSSALDIEMTADTARRSKKISAFPLKFNEYLKLKHGISIPKDFAETIRELVFRGDEKALKKAQKKEAEIQKKLIKISVLDKEFEDFLCYGGFPVGVNADQIDAHEKVLGMVDKVVEKDMLSIKSFNTDSIAFIKRIITFLALQAPGEVSDAALGNHLEMPASSVRKFLETLEKTHLIFSVKPFGGAGKTVRKSWKYYFLSPSINAALRYKLGRYSQRNKELMGILAETLAASYLFKIKESGFLGFGMFYDSQKRGADFLLQDPEGKIIPIEIGLGKQGVYQVKKSMSKHKSTHGIIISNFRRIEKKGNVIFIPLKVFALS